MRTVYLLLLALTAVAAIPSCNIEPAGDYALTFSDKPLRQDPNKICLDVEDKQILVDIIKKRAEDASESVAYEPERRRDLVNSDCACETAADVINDAKLVTEEAGDKIRVLVTSAALKATILDCIIPNDFENVYKFIQKGKIFLVVLGKNGGLKIYTFLQNPVSQLLPEKFIALEKPAGYNFVLEHFDIDLENRIIRISVAKEGLTDCVKEICYTYDPINYQPCLIGIDVVVDVRIRRGYRITDDYLNLEIFDLDSCDFVKTVFKSLTDVVFTCPQVTCNNIISTPGCELEYSRDDHNCKTGCFEGGKNCLRCALQCVNKRGKVEDISDQCIQGLHKLSCEPGPEDTCVSTTICTCGEKRINAIEACHKAPDGCTFINGPKLDENGCITECPALTRDNLQCECTCSEEDKPTLKEIAKVDFRCPSIDLIKFKCNTDEGCGNKYWEYYCDCPALTGDALLKCESEVPAGHRRQKIVKHGCLIGCRDVKIACGVDSCQELASAKAEVVIAEERDGSCAAQNAIALKCGRDSNDECKEWEINCCTDDYDNFRAKCISTEEVISRPYTDVVGCFAGCAFQCRAGACDKADLELCQGDDLEGKIMRTWPCIANDEGKCGWTVGKPCVNVDCLDGETSVNGKCFSKIVRVDCREVDFEEADEHVSADELLRIKILRELKEAGIKEGDDFEIDFEKIDTVNGIVSYVIGVLTDDNALLCKESVDNSKLFVGSASVDDSSSADGADGTDGSAACRLSSFL